MRSLLALAVVALVAVPSAAHALEQPKHRAISRDTCAAFGFPWNFCKRVGAEVYNVDAFEWNDLAAHAQPDYANGQSQCDGANSAAARVRSLGLDLHNGINSIKNGLPWANGTNMAAALGRALHTIQDNCAHRGVSNPHHAWHSLSDSCEGTSNSPDTRPEAVECAQRETEIVMEAFANAMSDGGLDPAVLDDGVREGTTHWPKRSEVCEFLGSGNGWNGADDHWNNDVVVPALRNQFMAGLFGQSISGDVCNGDGNAIAAWGDPSIDTSSGQGFCLKIQAYCVGKGDGVPEAPPWEDPVEAAIDNEGVEPQGCSVANDRAPGGWALLLLVALTAPRTTRQRRRRPAS